MLYFFSVQSLYNIGFNIIKISLRFQLGFNQASRDRDDLSSETSEKTTADATHEWDGQMDAEKEDREREKDTQQREIEGIAKLLTTLRYWSWAPSAGPAGAAGNRARRSKRSPSPVGRSSRVSLIEEYRAVWRYRRTATGSAPRHRPTSASSRRSNQQPCSSWRGHQRAPPFQPFF